MKTFQFPFYWGRTYMCILLWLVFREYLQILKDVGELDGQQFQQKDTFIIYSVSSAFDRRRGADKRPRTQGFSETHSQQNIWEVYLQSKRSEMPTTVKSFLYFSPSHRFSCSHRQNIDTHINSPFSTVTLAIFPDNLHNKVELRGSLSEKLGRVIL